MIGDVDWFNSDYHYFILPGSLKCHECEDIWLRELTTIPALCPSDADLKEAECDHYGCVVEYLIGSLEVEGTPEFLHYNTINHIWVLKVTYHP